jgi:hypothetical protein
VIARVRLGPWSTTPRLEDVDSAPVQRSGVTDADLRLLATRLAIAAAGQMITLEIDEAGVWRSETPSAASVVSDLFGAEYRQSEAYSPDGRSGSVARDAAAALRGEFESLYEDFDYVEGRIY